MSNVSVLIARKPAFLLRAGRGGFRQLDDTYFYDRILVFTPRCGSGCACPAETLYDILLHMEGKIRAHLTIEGRVQGVCFRAFVRDIARRSDVRGWVKNLYNGDVEAVLEGDKKDVSIVIANCYKGPPGSLVTNISIKWEDYTGSAAPFSITY